MSCRGLPDPFNKFDSDMSQNVSFNTTKFVYFSWEDYTLGVIPKEFTFTKKEEFQNIKLQEDYS